MSSKRGPANQGDAEALAWMETLNPAVSYFDPRDVGGPNKPGSEPELIVLLGWMGARPMHVAKYAVRYRTMYPSSRILVVQCPVVHLMLPSRARRDLVPALYFLWDLAKRQGVPAKGDEAPPPTMLLHIFSNGGANNATHLFDMLRGEAGGNEPRDAPALPRYVLILDCCPGLTHWMTSYRALMQILPWWASLLAHLLVANLNLSYFLRGHPGMENQNAKTLRSPALLESEVRRTYMYGTGDVLVPRQDIKDNAAEAREAGFNTRLEEFPDAEHVALMRASPERYWRVVQSSWEADHLPQGH